LNKRFPSCKEGLKKEGLTRQFQMSSMQFLIAYEIEFEGLQLRDWLLNFNGIEEVMDVRTSAWEKVT
jgi:hypothetical protein